MYMKEGEEKEKEGEKIYIIELVDSISRDERDVT